MLSLAGEIVWEVEVAKSHLAKIRKFRDQDLQVGSKWHKVATSFTDALEDRIVTAQGRQEEETQQELEESVSSLPEEFLLAQDEENRHRARRDALLRAIFLGEEQEPKHPIWGTPVEPEVEKHTKEEAASPCFTKPNGNGNSFSCDALQLSFKDFLAKHEVPEICGVRVAADDVAVSFGDGTQMVVGTVSNYLKKVDDSYYQR
jgi:hypothetical protein